MTTETQLITYEQYLNGPELKLRKEIVDGKLTISTSLTVPHQLTAGNIVAPLHDFVRNNKLGWVWFSLLDVIVQRDPLLVRQPDVLFVSQERAGILGDWINGGPDLVVEILTDFNRGGYLERKLADYARIDVRECWLVCMAMRTVEVFRQEGGKWLLVCMRGPGERLESSVLPGLEPEVDEIFRSI